MERWTRDLTFESGESRQRMLVEFDHPGPEWRLYFESNNLPDVMACPVEKYETSYYELTDDKLTVIVEPWRIPFQRGVGLGAVYDTSIRVIVEVGE